MFVFLIEKKLNKHYISRHFLKFYYKYKIRNNAKIFYLCKKGKIKTQNTLFNKTYSNIRIFKQIQTQQTQITSHYSQSKNIRNTFTDKIQNKVQVSTL